MRPSERTAWRAMGIYRRWTVFFLLQILTVLWWSFPQMFPGGQFGWNLAWSDLAVVVEMMVGIAFLNQMFRDGVVIRSELQEIKELHQEIRNYIRGQEPPA